MTTKVRHKVPRKLKAGRVSGDPPPITSFYKDGTRSPAMPRGKTPHPLAHSALFPNTGGPYHLHGLKLLSL